MQNKKMKFIGITGGVGAGKTTVLAAIEKQFSAKILLADEIAHLLMEPGTNCYDRLRELFGQDDVWQQDGSFDRGKLAGVLFSDAQKRSKLNAIVHPAVKEYVLEQVQLERERGQYEYLFLEAALLIEEGYDQLCDELWYIYTSEENRRARLIAGRGYSDQKIDDIFASQKSEEEFRKYCTREIDNNQDIDFVIKQLNQIKDTEGENDGQTGIER